MKGFPENKAAQDAGCRFFSNFSLQKGPKEPIIAAGALAVLAAAVTKCTNQDDEIEHRIQIWGREAMHRLTAKQISDQFATC